MGPTHGSLDSRPIAPVVLLAPSFCFAHLLSLEAPMTAVLISEDRFASTLTR